MASGNFADLLSYIHIYAQVELSKRIYIFKARNTIW